MKVKCHPVVGRRILSIIAYRQHTVACGKARVSLVIDSMLSDQLAVTVNPEYLAAVRLIGYGDNISLVVNGNSGGEICII